MQKEASVRFPDFQIFATLFFPLSLFPRVCWSFFLSLSLPKNIASPIRSSSSRALLLGVREREKERQREGRKVVLRSSIIIIIKYDQTRRQRRIQVAEIRSEEHQIGLVPEKLLPMHETGLSSQEASGKRTREVRKRAQSRETELVIAQSTATAQADKQAAERYPRKRPKQGGKEEE